MADVVGRQDPNRGLTAEGALVAETVLPAWHVGPAATLLTVSREVYSKRAVLAAAYKYSDRYAVLVDVDGDTRWAVYFTPSDPQDMMGVVAAFVKELIDQALREQLEREFGTVRDLVVAQAFSEGNLLDVITSAASEPEDA